MSAIPRFRLVDVSGAMHSSIEQLALAAGWLIQEAAFSFDGKKVNNILCIDESLASWETVLARAKDSSASAGPTIVVLACEGAVHRAAGEIWPDHWAWLPWPASSGWLRLALAQTVRALSYTASECRDSADAPRSLAVAERPVLPGSSRLLETALTESGLLTFEYDLASGNRRGSTRDIAILGRSPVEFDEALRLVHPDDRSSTKEAFERCREFGTRYSVEIRVLFGAGFYRWIRSEGAVVSRSAAHPGYLLGASWDVDDEKTATADVRLAKQQMHEVLQAAGMLVWDWIPGQHCRRVVSDGLGIFSATSGDRSLDDLILDEDRVFDRELFDCAARKKAGYRGSFRITTPNSGVRWLELFGQPRLGDAGEMISFAGFAFDKTAQRQIDEERERARVLLLDSLEAGRMYCWEWNLSDGTRRTLGPSQSILGTSPTESEAVKSLVHPEDLPAHNSLLQNAIIEQKAFQNEFRIVRPDGETRWLYSRGNSLVDSKGKVQRLSGVAIDITERRETEEKLADASRRLEIALEAARLNPWSVDLVTGVHTSGPRDVELFGEPIRHAAQLESLVVPEDRPVVEMLRNPAFLAQGESAHLEFRIRCRDGSLRWIACHARSVIDSRGQPIQLVGVSFDISEEKLAHERLARSLVQLDRVQVATHVILWEWNRRTGTRWYASAGEELSGEELPMVHPADRFRILRRVAECVRDAVSLDEEFRIQNSAGTFSWVALHGGRSVSDPELGMTLSGVIIDITARKQAAQQLRAAQRRLDRALEAAKMVCWDWSIDSSESFDSGYSPYVASAGAYGAGGVVHPNDRERHRQAINDAMNGIMAEYRCEFRMVRPTGEVAWLLSIGSRLIGADGRATGLTGVAIDITQQRRTQEELSESREWQRLAVRAAGLNLWRVDLATGQLRESSPNKLSVVFAKSNIQNIHQLVHPVDRQRVDEAWRLSIDTGQPLELEYRVLLAEGVIRWLRVRGERVSDAMIDHAQIVGATIDITEQKDREDALQAALAAAHQASEAKSAFLAMISHELRTPLNAVIGFSELLATTGMDDRQQTHLEGLTTGARQLYSLINDVLDFSRIEAGQMNLECTSFCPRECLESAIDLVAQVADEKGLCLLMISQPMAERKVIGDPTRLRQIFVNLLSNATKFTECGAVVVELEASVDDDGLALRIRVRDTGIGMTDDVIANLFQPFQQGDASTTRRFGGTGLGLSICKRLVALMEGQIRATSIHGSGSCFEVDVSLPLDDLCENALPSLPGRRVGIAVRSKHLEAGLIAQLQWFGIHPVVIDPMQLASALAQNERRLDAMVIGMPLQSRFLDLLAQPKTREGSPLPTIVLVGLDQPLEMWTGSRNERYYPVPRAVKPQQLFRALEVAMDSVPEARQKKSIPTSASPCSGVSESRFSKMRILVAEDNEINQLLLLAQLQVLGASARLVSTGSAALDALNEQPFDVVLMDVEMPEMDGIEAAAIIRASDSAMLRATYLVAVTAHALGDSHNRFIKSGMNDFVCKPVMIASLTAALDRALAAKKIRQPVGN